MFGSLGERLGGGNGSSGGPTCWSEVRPLREARIWTPIQLLAVTWKRRSKKLFAADRTSRILSVIATIVDHRQRGEAAR